MPSEKQIACVADAIDFALGDIKKARLFVDRIELIKDVVRKALTAAEQAEPLPTEYYYPIEMPLNEDGQGPASFEKGEVRRLVFEVWDQDFQCHGTFETLSGAIAHANKLNAPAARSGAVWVRQLEWEETHSRRSEEDPTTEWNGGFEAESALGFYEISMGFGSDAYYWSVTNPLGDDVGSNFEDPLYAKAAAQADYERRVLAALEPAELAGFLATLSEDQKEAARNYTGPDTEPATDVEPVQCEHCQGNGEIVTDWERYLHSHEGDVGDEAVAECPDCDGQGYTSPQPESRLREALEHVTELLVDTWNTKMEGDPERQVAVRDARAALAQGADDERS